MKKLITILPKLHRLPALVVLFTIAIWLLQYSGVKAAPPPQAGDIAVISSPTSNAVVSGTVEILGSADHPSFQFYVVDIGPEPNIGDQWSTIGATHDTPVINGRLETWDTRLVPDGSYTIRLRVVRLDGNYTEFFARQVVVSNTQPVSTDTPAAPAPEKTTRVSSMRRLVSSRAFSDLITKNTANATIRKLTTLLMKRP